VYWKRTVLDNVVVSLLELASEIAVAVPTRPC
jgi:hypothetical protein